MLYVFRKAVSESARELAEAMPINCRKLNDLRKAHYGQGVRAGDAIVAWGEEVAPIDGVRILNGGPIRNKMEDAQRLSEANVATVEVSRVRPPVQVVIDTYNTTAAGLTRQQVQELVLRLQRFLATPVPAPAIWLPRRFNHIGGADLLRSPTQPDYFSKKEDLRQEFRIHMFKGRSIRAGVKVQRDGAEHHPWIRSYEGGWSIRYDGYESTRDQRRLASAACEALGLDFGAVDIGQKIDGTQIVLETNRAPGLEGGTIEAYSRAIEGWVRGEDE